MNELPPNTTYMVKVPIESKVAHKKKDVPFLSMDQANAFYDVPNYRDKNNVQGYKRSNNAHALILILYTGMRAGEMIKYFADNDEATGDNDYVCVSSNGTKINRRNLSHTLASVCKDTGLPMLSYMILNIVVT